MTVVEPIVTREHSTIEADLPDHTARRLPELTNGHVQVRPRAGDGWLIDTTEWVGTVVIDDMRLLIRPKVPLHNLFLMLTAGLPGSAWRNEQFGYAQSASLLDSIAGFFARQAWRTLSAGLLRSYRVEHDELVALRGRIDMPAVFRQPGRASPVPCSFDDFTADVLENRALRAATRLLLRQPLTAPGVRSELHRVLVLLEGVADEPVTSREINEWLARRVNRLNEHYVPAMRLAELILDRASLLDRAGDRSGSAFLLDMNDLFQRFLTLRLQQLTPRGLRVLAEPPGHHLDRERTIGLWPDLVVTDPRQRPLYVGDVKYKLAAPGKARSGDYYQMLAYCTGLDLPEGVLIYCLADGADPADATVKVVKHLGTRLSLYHLDMSGSVADVERAVAELARWLSDQATGTAALQVA